MSHGSRDGEDHAMDSIAVLNRGVDFVYGVIVALAIGKGLEGYLHGFAPWLIDRLHSTPGISGGAHGGSGESPGKSLELIRLVVFLVMVIRFYLGSIAYFHRTYPERTTRSAKVRSESALYELLIGVVDFVAFYGSRLVRRFPYRPTGPIERPGAGAYLWDFLFGLGHFALFFAWSLTLTSPEHFGVLTPYLAGLGVILLYDGLWYVLVLPPIDKWVRRNVLTVGVCGMLLMIAAGFEIWSGRQLPLFRIELGVSLLVLWQSYADIGELITGKQPDGRALLRSARRARGGRRGMLRPRGG